MLNENKTELLPIYNPDQNGLFLSPFKHLPVKWLGITEIDLNLKDKTSIVEASNT